MGIDYKFNEWRVSGEQAEVWSPLAYRLYSKNVTSESVNGFRVGHILYLHHIKGMAAKEIKHSLVGFGLHLNLIKSILRGFRSRSANAGRETMEAYEIAMYLVECQPEMLEKMYQT
ncbi:hypothetical protein ACFWMS_02070 [Peribacillus butanolivorans]|uniref:hypothetical protein n=1 Tax=Peribacillus butanolivorans TaxID=421767 RepID=UPI00365A7B24